VTKLISGILKHMQFLDLHHLKHIYVTTIL